MADDLGLPSGIRTREQRKRKIEKKSGQGKRKERKEKVEASREP